MSSSQKAFWLASVDHLVWGGPDLDREIDRLEQWTGVRAVLGGRHPDPVAIIEWLRPLGLELPVVAGRAPALIATLDTPRGRLELR
jgi:hypothetical protein